MPNWTIETKFQILTDEQYRKLLGFVALLKGAHIPFLWLDPEDYEEKGIQLPLITNGTYQAVMKMGDYVEPVEYIEKVTRPKFIRYCKVNTDIKKAHARELRTTGYIKYNKVDDQSTKA